MKSMVFRLSALALAAALGACGGGGDPAPVDNGPAFTVGGNAVKGPMDKALVVAYKVNADGTKGDELGRDVSGPDGAYNILVRNYTGVVLVEVTTTADTTMVDEATGETVTPPSDFSMRASVAAPATTTTPDTKLTLQVNPLTEMAVATAVKAGGLTTDNVEAANAEIRTVYGFNPTDDAPVFTNGVPQNKAAVVFSAISGLAKDGGFDACASESSQADRVKCVVTQLAEKGAQNADVANALNLQIAVVSQTEGVPTTAVPTVNTEVPPVAPEVAAVPQVKALMTSLRSNVEALAAPDMSLQTKLQDMQNTLNNSVTPVVDSTFEMLRTMDFGVQLLEDYKAGVVGSTTRANRVTGLPYGAGCTLFTGDKDDAGNYTFRMEATSKDNAEVVGCSSYASVSRNQQDAVTGTTNTWRWRHRLLIAPKADAAGTYVVNTAARREYGTCSNAAGSASCGTFTQTSAGTADQGKPDPVGNYKDNAGYSVQRGQEGLADFTRTVTNGSVSGLRLVGSTAPSLAYTAPGQTPVLDTYGQRHEVNLDVAVTTTGTAETLTLASDAYIKFFSKDTAEGATVFRSSIGIGKDSYIKAPVAPNAQDGTEAFKLAIGFVSGNSALRGSLEATDAKWDKSQTVYSPTKVTFGGRLETRESATSDWVDFIRGTLTMEATNFADFDGSQPTSNANPQIMTATLNAAVTIPNRPVLGVRNMVIVSTDKGPNDSSTELAGQYVQGSLVINVNSTATDTTTAVFESSSGIKLSYDNTKTVHPLTKSGIKVGEYNSTSKRITYADDSFEQY